MIFILDINLQQIPPLPDLSFLPLDPSENKHKGQLAYENVPVRRQLHRKVFTKSMFSVNRPYRQNLTIMRIQS